MSISQAEPPRNFVDPVTYELMVDPVVCSDGHTYDRSVAQKLDISPFTREPFKILVDNVDLRSDIFERYPMAAKQYAARRTRTIDNGLVKPTSPNRAPYSAASHLPPLPHRPDSGVGYEDFETGRYEGEFFGGQAHGHGVFVYHTGGRYSGEWFYGEMHGKGRTDYAAGHYYEGEFSHNQRHGKAHCTWTDGSSYDGEFANGERHGFGITTKGGYRYEGTYRYGKVDGWAKETIDCVDYKSLYNNGQLVVRRPIV